MSSAALQLQKSLIMNTEQVVQNPEQSVFTFEQQQGGSLDPLFVRGCSRCLRRNELGTSMIHFTVYGKPIPQGSQRAFMRPGMRQPVITSDNRALGPWRLKIGAVAESLKAQKFDRGAPVEVAMDFYFARPGSAKARKSMTVRPDLDKLVRAVFDAITGILIADDAQIVEHHARKYYGEPERVEIEIYCLTPAGDRS